MSGVGCPRHIATISKGGKSSGTTRQLKLYRHLGFTPFGPLVGESRARYQPMFLTLETFSRTCQHNRALRKIPVAPKTPLNLLPGPVLTSPAVDAAFAAPAISHRSAAFRAQLDTVRARLRALTGARHVQILPGSGSLANVLIAAQLTCGDQPGLVLSNGEFGERLIAEARRARLRFDPLEFPWACPFALPRIEALASRLSPGGWIWFVHHETSAGMLNPLDELKRIAVRHQLRLCVDCVSSLGALPVDLRGVHLASGTSGKALAGYPGLALVFHDYTPVPNPAQLPSYIDLGHWAAHDSVPHTHSSNLVSALATALDAITSERLKRIQTGTTWLRGALRAQGWALVAPDSAACPGLITIALGAPGAASRLGRALAAQGFLLHFETRHLVARNWLQISLFGDPPHAALESLRRTFAVARNEFQTARTSAVRFHAVAREPELTTA